MNNSLSNLIAVGPFVPLLVWWWLLMRSGRLRIRVMAATTAAAVFASLTCVELFLVEAPVNPPFGLRALAFKLIVATAIGATILLWWPILGKGLRRMGIKW